MSTSRFYSDEFLAERSKKASRAMAEKARGGELPGCAPVGYKNERTLEGTRVVLDEKLAPLVREAFEMAASGQHSLRAILKIMTENGLVSRNGKPLGVSSLWKILKNPFYTGLMRYDGEILRGKHPALIENQVFAAVQEILTRWHC